MSNALAIAGVTAVLRDMLDSGLIDHEVTDAMGQGVAVSAVAPDTIAIQGPDAKPQLNVFLHQVSHNAALRNLDLPSRSRNGDRLSNAPLALDLHYLVTAYGTSDLQAEVLLGYAMQLLHETPIPARAAIRTALNPPNVPVDGALLPSVYQALRASDLADQYEQIKITPAPMNMEEMSKLWSALQARYRPTAAYQVSMLLIEATQPARAPLPVLTRGPREPSLIDPTIDLERGVVARPDLMPAFPELENITLPDAQTVVHLSDVITLSGHHLDGSDHTLLLSLPRLDIEQAITPASSANASAVSFTLPDQPSDFPAGSYLLALQVLRPGESSPRASNQLLLSVAPQITSLVSPPQMFARDGDDTAVVTIACKPQVRPNQRAALILGSREVMADAHTLTTDTLTFTVLLAPVGVHLVRLRVDGVDSQIVDRSVSPPQFLDRRIEIV